MPKATVVIQGVSPLLMHKYPEVPIENIEKKTKEEQAEISAHRIEGSKELCIPGVAIQRALIMAAAYSKGKGRSSLQKLAAACFDVTPENVGLGKKDYKIDSRPVVIPATRGRCMRHRPRIEEWKATFGLAWDDSLLNEEQVRRIIADMGSKVGLLDWRPACKGPFGRCKMVKMEVSK